MIEVSIEYLTGLILFSRCFADVMVIVDLTLRVTLPSAVLFINYSCSLDCDYLIFLFNIDGRSS